MLDIHPEDLEYPTSDGKPMGETDEHRDQMIALIQTLSDYFRDDPQVYVTGDLLLFYEEGNKRKHLSPDVMVVQGVEKRRRKHYLLWREGKAPDLVFEITSASTRKEDMGKKRRLYATLGVREYVLFDPRQEYLEPRLRLLRWNGEDYVPVVGKLVLETIGLELAVVNDELRLARPDGTLLATREESLAEGDAALAEAQHRLQALEERLRQLEG
ncbi:MAG: Uma2 family endonuclease [Vulcanimicrobiota bacterium]